MVSLAEREIAPAVSAPDPTFARWAADGLVWLAEHGMGYYPVREFPYDDDYFLKYQAYAQTDLGRALTRSRFDLVARHASPDAFVCDVGIGCGSFVEFLVDHGRVAFGYDVNPRGIEWLRERGRWMDPLAVMPDVLTFWDSLEHVGPIGDFVSAAREWVFVSLPIFSGPGDVLRSRHFRRDEHRWYWTRNGLTDWMAEQGLRCVEHSTVETALGRESIETFAFRRAA